MTITHLTHPEAPAPADPGPRRRSEFDDEMARLIRERVQADLAKRHARRLRNRQARDDLARRRRHAKAALHGEELAARAQQACRCAQPRPPALLTRDPGGGSGVLTICPACGRGT
ncbi:hypothetical protein E1212_25390 [Jiangella ureilytica]|uniref:Uncharacterized protein n=1 Tax=Jiangella ureilytica TaxID=2530374 RepID=A0A4R4RCP7_9ACTN|nr:hypothetical protein [Jiangella ureilytica]TDC47051.1 hypothetical protein E1212_25390 [Jiangella ureilytica]